MTDTRPRLVPSLLVAVAVLALAGRAAAQPYDHLECYKIKDLQPKKKYTATLTPQQTQFLTQTGCQLKVPAKLLCINVEKSNVVPAPPLALNGADTRDFLCYNLKCPKLDLPFAFEDQFGSRNITVKKPHQLCAPAREVGDPGPATPTPCLPNPTPTPGNCMDLMQNGAETDIDCGGPCPPCMNGEGCGTATDCQSGICTSGTCTFCSPGQTQSCGTMLPGACSVGTRTCNMTGTAFGACQAPPGSPETCNNVDDDCDGMVDDGLGQTTCGTGACQNTVQNCVGGVSQSCTPGLPGTETCNSIDDNCDGMVDNNACPVLPNTIPSCNGVTCSYICSMGYSDCNANMADGCEVFGSCAQPDGFPCASAAQCASANCVDGVCCNTACNALCQACSLAKNGSANGTCLSIPAGTDPDSECTGTCDGAGACQP
jgi:hypothetical protein